VEAVVEITTRNSERKYTW